VENTCEPIGGRGAGGFDGGDIGGGTGGGGGGFVALLTGSPHSVQLSVAPVQVCSNAKTPATRVMTTVLGPDNLPVDHTNNGASNGSSELDPYTTTLTFTPMQPGAYHLVAQFDPNLGTAQLDVEAALDFTQLPVVETFPRALTGQCYSVAVTASGTLLCEDLTTHTSHAYRDGGAVGGFMEVSFAVQGDTVWAAGSNNQVTRYFDTGTGPLPAMETFTPSQPVAALVPITDDAVLVVTASGAERWMRAHGGFAPEHVWTYVPTTFCVPGQACLPPTYSAAIDGDAILVSWDGFLFESSDGGTTLALGPAVGYVLDFNRDGIWAFTPGDSVLALYRPGQAVPKTLNLRLSWYSFPEFYSPGWDVRPWVTQGTPYVAIYDAAQDALVLADFGGFVQAGHDWVIAGTADDLVVKKMPAP
jgi:hypothetical protein